MYYRRLSLIAAVAAILFSVSGCSLCCSPYLDDYVTFGSKTPRMDMKNGRVGSVFSDPQLMGTHTVSSPSNEILYDDEPISEDYSNDSQSRIDFDSN